MTDIGRRLFVDAAALVGWLALCFAAAALGAVASANAPDSTATHAARMGAAGVALRAGVDCVVSVDGDRGLVVWRERGFRGAPVALGLFIVQLAANALWSWLFFAWHLGRDLVRRDRRSVGTDPRHNRCLLARAAGRRHALLPYLAWVTFAAALNYAIWQLNPQLLAQR